MIKDFSFLTTNTQKAKNARDFGFEVKNFGDDIPEILSDNVQEIALYKAKDTNLNNIIVEDTALYIQDSPFMGTQIKHIYEEIKNNDLFHNRNAQWTISLCLVKDDIFYSVTETVHGILTYPPIEDGYHFEKFFSVKHNNRIIRHPHIIEEDKKFFHPRLIALSKLRDVIINDKLHELPHKHRSEILEWDKDYQVENNSTKKLKI